MAGEHTQEEMIGEGAAAVPSPQPLVNPATGWILVVFIYLFLQSYVHVA